MLSSVTPLIKKHPFFIGNSLGKGSRNHVYYSIKCPTKYRKAAGGSDPAAMKAAGGSEKAAIRQRDGSETAAIRQRSGSDPAAAEAPCVATFCLFYLH